MNYNIITSSYFNVAAKRLAKKYPSFKDDLRIFRNELLENPLQGDELSPSIKSKGKGKSRGARIITYNFIAHEVGDVIVLLLVYDKGDASSVKTNVIKQIIKEEGYPI